MSTSAAQHIREAPEHTTTPVDIRVIPGGLLREKSRPRHAKGSVLSDMRGVGFNLSAAERIWAGAFGTLFTLAALAAALM